MEKNYFIICCSVFFCNTLFAQQKTGGSATSLREQLTVVNAEWTKQDAALGNGQALVFTDDDALIQAHLQTVEQYLRTKNTVTRTPLQAAARSASLDELQRYWQQKRFPRNTNHSERTPYFIDKYGSACAVGQLIIASGRADLAKKIQHENNYAYINDLAKIYPELTDWADENGFDLDELAWIQPDYPCANPTPCNPGEVHHPSCSNSSDGSIGYPIVTDTAVHFPVFYNLWLNTGTGWSDIFDNRCLYAGEYKWTLTDVNGTVHSYPTTLIAPPAVTLAVVKTPDTGTCNGTATVNISEPVTANYYWYPTQQQGQTATNLCAGTHSVVVTYTNICTGNSGTNMVQYFQIENLTSTITTADNTIIKISPNPASTHIYIAQAKDSQGIAVFSDIWGRNLKTATFQSNKSLDVSDLPKGVYFVHLKTAETISTQRLILE